MKTVLLSKFRIVSIVSAMILFVVYVCSFNSLPASSANTARQYKRYNAATGNLLGSYSLTVEHGEQPMLCDLVGDEDTRYVDWSKSGVVKICGYEENSNKEKFLGTGFVVGKHAIATDAHVVVPYVHKTGIGYVFDYQKISQVKLFNADGTVSKTLEPSNSNMEYHVPMLYLENDATYPYDYAVITVSEDLSKYQCFDLGYVTDSLIKSNSENVFVTGFPGTVRGEDVNTYDIDNMYTGEGILLNQEQFGINISNGLIYYSVDTSGGNSGSPVYIKETVRGRTFYTVIGLLNTGDGMPYYRYNCGVRFDSYILKFYKGNPNIQ